MRRYRVVPSRNDDGTWLTWGYAGIGTRAEFFSVGTEAEAREAIHEAAIDYARRRYRRAVPGALPRPDGDWPETGEYTVAVEGARGPFAIITWSDPETWPDLWSAISAARDQVRRLSESVVYTVETSGQPVGGTVRVRDTAGAVVWQYACGDRV